MSDILTRLAEATEGGRELDTEIVRYERLAKEAETALAAMPPAYYQDRGASLRALRARGIEG